MSDLFTNILSEIVNTLPNSSAKQAFTLATEIVDMVDSDREVNHSGDGLDVERAESAQIATLRAQVDKLNDALDRAIDNANAYSEALNAMPKVSRPRAAVGNVIAKIRPALLAFAAYDLRIPAIKLVKRQADCDLLSAKGAVDDLWPILRAEARSADRLADRSL